MSVLPGSCRLELTLPSKPLIACITGKQQLCPKWRQAHTCCTGSTGQIALTEWKISLHIEMGFGHNQTGGNSQLVPSGLNGKWKGYYG